MWIGDAQLLTCYLNAGLGRAWWTFPYRMGASITPHLLPWLSNTSSVAYVGIFGKMRNIAETVWRRANKLSGDQP